MTLAQIGVSGMLGLGFPSIATIQTKHGLGVILNIIYSLPSQQQFFAFRLGRNEGDDSGNSTFNIGMLPLEIMLLSGLLRCSYRNL